MPPQDPGSLQPYHRLIEGRERTEDDLAQLHGTPQQGRCEEAHRNSGPGQICRASTKRRGQTPLVSQSKFPHVGKTQLCPVVGESIHRRYQIHKPLILGDPGRARLEEETWRRRLLLLARIIFLSLLHCLGQGSVCLLVCFRSIPTRSLASWFVFRRRWSSPPEDQKIPARPRSLGHGYRDIERPF